MSLLTQSATRPQLALQSYLDDLLQEAFSELDASQGFDEFEMAVREEQARDAYIDTLAASPARSLPRAEAQAETPPRSIAPAALTVAPERAAPPVLLNALAESLPIQAAPPPARSYDGRPDWAQAPFECLLFDVAGLTLAVPLISLGTIYPLAGQELTPLFGQPDWFLGLLPGQSGNLRVLDTARWVMAERYREDFRAGLQYVISVEGYEWGLAVHQVSRSIRLDPSEIKWRSQRSQRPWLAGTVIEHMCALLDVAALAELIVSGAARERAAGRLD